MLKEWETFYLIVGAAAGALIGLQFVVMTLIADRPIPGISETGRAFATPTVVHFSACLLTSALVQMPWPHPGQALWAGTAVGLGGLVYMALPIQRMRRQHTYQMDNEDRLFHVALPFVAYGLLAAQVLLANGREELGLFGIAGAALMLLFIGIHNAWDAIAYQVYVVRSKDDAG